MLLQTHGDVTVGALGAPNAKTVEVKSTISDHYASVDQQLQKALKQITRTAAPMPRAGDIAKIDLRIDNQANTWPYTPAAVPGVAPTLVALCAAITARVYLQASVAAVLPKTRPFFRNYGAPAAGEATQNIGGPGTAFPRSTARRIVTLATGAHRSLPIITIRIERAPGWPLAQNDLLSHLTVQMETTGLVGGVPLAAVRTSVVKTRQQNNGGQIRLVAPGTLGSRIDNF